MTKPLQASLKDRLVEVRTSLLQMDERGRQTALATLDCIITDLQSCKATNQETGRGDRLTHAEKVVDAIVDDPGFHDKMWEAIRGLEISHGDDYRRLKAKLSLHEFRVMIMAFQQAMRINER